MEYGSFLDKLPRFNLNDYAPAPLVSFITVSP